VAAGGDIKAARSPPAAATWSANDNQAVTGDHNTTAFGSGDATNANLGHTSIGDGGFAVLGGDAYGSNTQNDTNTSVHSSGSGDTSVNAAGSHGDASQYANQSEHDDSTHSNYEDSSTSNSHDGLRLAQQRRLQRQPRRRRATTLTAPVGITRPSARPAGPTRLRLRHTTPFRTRRSGAERPLVFRAPSSAQGERDPGRSRPPRPQRSTCPAGDLDGVAVAARRRVHLEGELARQAGQGALSQRPERHDLTCRVVHRHRRA